MPEQRRYRGLMMPPQDPDPHYRGLLSSGSPQQPQSQPRMLMQMDRPEGRHWMAPDPDLPEFDRAELGRMVIKVFTLLTLASGVILWYSLYAHAVLNFLHHS